MSLRMFISKSLYGKKKKKKKIPQVKKNKSLLSDSYGITKQISFKPNIHIQYESSNSRPVVAERTVYAVHALFYTPIFCK